MNNDFNFRPTRPSQPAQSASSAGDQGEQAGQEEQGQAADTARRQNTNIQDSRGAPQQPQQAVVTSKKSSGAAKKFFSGLLLLILVVLAAGGVYYWQQSQVKDLTTSRKGLQSQVNSLQTALAKEKATTIDKSPAAVSQPVTTYNIITGSVTGNVGNAADVSVQYLPGTAKEVWVEYGSKPDDLKQMTKRFSGNSEGTAGTYIEQAVTLTGLQTGTKYFYRAAGTVNDKTVYGGVVSFTATK